MSCPVLFPRMKLFRFTTSAAPVQHTTLAYFICHLTICVPWHFCGTQTLSLSLRTIISSLLLCFSTAKGKEIVLLIAVIMRIQLMFLFWLCSARPQTSSQYHAMLVNWFMFFPAGRADGGFGAGMLRAR